MAVKRKHYFIVKKLGWENQVSARGHQSALDGQTPTPVNAYVQWPYFWGTFGLLLLTLLNDIYQLHHDVSPACSMVNYASCALVATVGQGFGVSTHTSNNSCTFSVLKSMSRVHLRCTDRVIPVVGTAWGWFLINARSVLSRP